MLWNFNDAFFPLHVLFFIFCSQVHRHHVFFFLGFRFNSITIYPNWLMASFIKGQIWMVLVSFCHYLLFCSFTNRATVIGMKSRIFNRPYHHVMGILLRLWVHIFFRPRSNLFYHHYLFAFKWQNHSKQFSMLINRSACNYRKKAKSRCVLSFLSNKIKSQS